MSGIRIYQPNKIMLCVLLAALCLFLNASAAHCQQIPNSTQSQQQETDEQRRIRLIEALERAQDEVKVSRRYIAELEKSVKSKQAIIDAQGRRQTLSDEAIASQQKEIQISKALIENQQIGLNEAKAKAEYLKKELDATNKKLKRSRSFVKYLLVVTGVLTVAVLAK